MNDFRFNRGDAVWIASAEGGQADVVKDRARVMGINVYYLTIDRSRGALPEFALQPREVASTSNALTPDELAALGIDPEIG